MAANPINPLTPEHLQQIRNALDQVKVAKAQIELAKRAGIDVAQLESINDANEDKLLKLKQVYFPGQ